MRRLVFSLLVCAGAVLADFNVQQWAFRVPVTVGGTISEFTVGPEIYRYSAARLSDLRIVRDGVEVPYVMKRLDGDLRLSEHSVEIVNKEFSKGTGVRAVLDLQGHEKHNRLRIVTREQNFQQAVVVETSDDLKRWSTVLADGVIFDISRPEKRVSDTTVSYPTSTRRYVRVTIPGWRDPAALESVWLAEYRESEATRDTIAELRPVVTQRAAEQTTELVFDFGYPGQACDRLDLRTGAGLFSRAVEIASSDDLKGWTGRSGAWVDHLHLSLDFGETWERYIKVTIFNGDSAPIGMESARASVVRRMVRFPSSAAGRYWVYLGRSTARWPSYDFGRVEDPDARAGVAVLGRTEVNLKALRIVDRPYSERKPWVLNVILGIAVAVMAFITYRFARKATSPGA
jgi:hypothetical protein